MGCRKQLDVPRCPRMACSSRRHRLPRLPRLPRRHAHSSNSITQLLHRKCTPVLVFRSPGMDIRSTTTKWHLLMDKFHLRILCKQVAECLAVTFSQACRQVLGSMCLVLCPCNTLACPIRHRA